MKIKTIVGGAALALVSAVGIYQYSSESIVTPPTLETTTTLTSKEENHFLVISDPHLHKGINQDMIGKHTADSGEDLWKITLTKFEEVIEGKTSYPIPKFIVLLGDLPWHASPIDQQELAVAHASTKQVLIDLRTAAQKANIPLIYSPGNNDSWGGDYRAFTTDGILPFDLDSVGRTDWPVIYSGTCNTGKKTACLADTSLKSLGCYAVYPLGEDAGLKMIVLNSVMFNQDDTNHYGVYYYGKPGLQQTNVQQQMTWLENQFATSDSTEAIMIGMHIPVGTNSYPDGYDAKGNPIFSEMWSEELVYKGKTIKNAFLDLMAQHQDQVVGVLTSHTHMDGLRKMMYEEGGKLKFSDLIVSIPGITPGHGNNPSMKLFSYHSANFEWKNFTTLYNDFHQTSTVSSSFGDKSFSFADQFKADTNLSMRDNVALMDSIHLDSSVSNIYTAMGDQLGRNNVSITLEVKP